MYTYISLLFNNGGDRVLEIGLVLEGGGLRGVFTAGVLDFLMEKNLYFPYVVGVSAGACNSINYVSKQIGRTKKCMIPKNSKEIYFGLKQFKTSKKLLDLDKVFFDYSYNTYPFDFNSYFNSNIINEIVVTNCLTGKAEYLIEKSNKERLLNIGKASSSIPAITPMVYVDKIPYLDGGLAVSLPIDRAIKQGFKKNIVILTQRKDTSGNMTKLENIFYSKYLRKYPNLVKTMNNRHKVYLKDFNLLEQLEKEKKIFIIQPENISINRLEGNTSKLLSFYNHGYNIATQYYEDLLKFIKQT